MSYACPVCDTQQADAVHLANHLAITASLGRQDHSEWLAEHAPEWSECTPEELGEIVSQHVPEIDTSGVEASSHGHDHGRPESLEEGLARQSRQPGRGALSVEAESVLEEARELTQQMASDDDDDGSVDETTAATESTDDSRT